MTLDEWKAQQDRNRTKAAFNIRKAGEGVSAAPEWKKMFVLKKKVEEHDEEEEEEEEVCFCLLVDCVVRLACGNNAH